MQQKKTFVDEDSSENEGNFSDADADADDRVETSVNK